MLQTLLKYKAIILMCSHFFNMHCAHSQTLDYLYDPTFTPENIVGGNGGSANSILVHENGQYTVVGGFQFNYPFQITGAVRFFNNGTLDGSFSLQSEPALASYIQFHGGGYLMNVPGRLFFIEYNGSYTTEGLFFLNYSWLPYIPETWPPPTVDIIQVLENNKIMVAGRFSPDTTNLEDRRQLVRVMPDGSPDPSFEPLKCHEPNDARIIDFYPTPDGKWMVAGEFMDVEGFESPGIARLNTDFSVDTTFKSPFPHFEASVRIIPGDHPQKLTGAIDEQNRVYISRIEPGFTNPLNGLKHLRLLYDGSLDSTFEVNDIYYLNHFSESYSPGSIYTIAFEPDGSLIVGGRFRKIEGQPRGNIAKLNEDGSLVENVFNRLGADTAHWGFIDNEPTITCLVRLDNGGLMVGGCFSRYDGHEQWGLVRLVPSPVGIGENNANEIPISCFPNPASNFLHFAVSATEAYSLVQIEVFDASGKMVLSHSDHFLQQPIDVSSLKPGLYSVVVHFEDQQKSTTRFVRSNE